MSLIKYHSRPVSFSNLFDTFFNEHFAGTPARSSSKSFVPQVDIAETDKAFELEFVVPGVDKKGFNIELHEGRLSVSGERKDEQEEKGKNFYTKESYYGNFSRSFYLPDGIQEDKVEADYKDGILRVVIPKDQKKIEKKSVVVK